MNNMFDKNTLGNSPASIYLIDLLNQIERKKAVCLIKSYSDFKEIFKELMDAHDDGAVSAKLVRNYIETYRSTLPEKKSNLLDKDYDIKVVNLYENLLIAEFKKAIRKLDAKKKIEISAIARAKHNLKSDGKTLNNQKIPTIGKYKGDEINVEVKFNQHGIGSSFLNLNLIKDNITNESLMKKSLKRLERRNLK